MRIGARSLIALVPVVALTGCLSIKNKADFEGRLHGWVGKPFSEFSMPNAKLTSIRTAPDGQKTCVFEHQKTQTDTTWYTEYRNLDTGQSGSTDANGNPPAWVTAGTTRVQTVNTHLSVKGNLYCRITLVVGTDGIITSTKYEGNDCW